MKNLSKKITTALVFCTLSIAQVTATPVTSLKIEKENYKLFQTTEAYTKISCFKSWFLSLLNKKDYVVEDSLLNKYMLGSSNEATKLTKEEENLLSNYMYGMNNNSIAYSYNLEDISFATEIDDEDNNDEEYIFEE